MKRITLGALLLVGGCANEYAYIPAENATARVNGQSAAAYHIPPEAPQGDVRVTSFGVTKLKVNNQEEHVRAMHVRMVVANNSDAPWTVDTRQQIGVIPNEGRSRPMYASSDGGQLPLVTVPARGRRTIDLFYPLPQGMQKASRLPQFDLLWTVDTQSRQVAMRTPFERIEIEPVYAYDYGWGYYGYYGPGWAPYYWYDPFYASYTFSHPAQFHHHPVVVGHPAVVGPPAAARPVYRR